MEAAEAVAVVDALDCCYCCCEMAASDACPL